MTTNIIIERTTSIENVKDNTGVKKDTRYDAIKNWYETGLIRIDKPLATEYNETNHRYKIADKSRWDQRVERNGIVFKNPTVQYNANFVNIDKIARGHFNPHHDFNIFRFHSALTNCKKELRHAITIDNKEVVAVDLSNSQPTLLTIMLQSNFWTGTKGFTALSIPYFNHLKAFKPTNLSLLIKLCSIAESNEDSTLGKELVEYRKWVADGKFYHEFRRKVESVSQRSLSSISDVKIMFFLVLFTDNRYIGQDEAAPKRAFRDCFPELYKLSNLIKSKDAANLPILLQRIESYIMYYRIMPRITVERPDLPIIPIHDSIATLRGEEGYIEQVMCEELEECLGFPPHFKHEIWDKATLKDAIIKMNAERQYNKKG